MAAPTVTRPAHPNLAGQESNSPFTAANVAKYAKWVVLGVVLCGALTLAIVITVTLVEEARVERLRTQWDILYAALKDKNLPEDRIAALENVAEKIKGTPAHAYALMQLGDLYFEEALKDKNLPEQRAAALKKAISLYNLVATQEPYRGNPAFGPVALEYAALAYEQAGDYDAAIKFLKDSDPQANYLTNKLTVQLGRLYYLRSLKDTDKSAAEADREEARNRLAAALRGLAAGGDEGQNQNAEFIHEAEYLKTLVDKPGKALPDGKAPPVKLKPQVPAAVDKAAPPADKAEKKETPDKPVAEKPKDAPAQDLTKKDEPKKEETTKEDPPKAEK